ncbi:hypothetical protein HanRHA438_Chr10g0469421 [Helianthus annuus]|nr:hypothetical protein HanRHA438_Chr10g0469421 [Helianthus annuus]
MQNTTRPKHNRQILQLHFGSLLQTRPPPFQPRKRIFRHLQNLTYLLVKRVLSPRQMRLRVRHQNPIHQRVTRPTNNPHPFQQPTTSPLIKCGFFQHLIIRHRPGPPDTHVGKHPGLIDHTLDRN